MTRRRTAIALAALFMCCPAAGSADPIQIVGGTFTVGAWIPTTMNLIGADGSRFTATWTGQTWDIIDAAALCSPCGGGTLVSPNVSTSAGPPPPARVGAAVIAGGAVVGGVHYPPPGPPFMALGLNLLFTGEGFATANPGSVPEDSVFQALAPFTFAGQIEGYDIFRFDPLQLFSAELFGGGTARIEFLREGDLNQLLYYRTIYEFSEPVPEPATWLLVGSGALALRTMRRRSKARVA